MLTKRKILETGERAHYGSVAELEPKFRSWQRFGLVGGAVGKTARRGGEGLWHPIQGAIFLAILNNLAQGVRLTTMANLPVGLWMAGVEGVELRQVQRALYYWITRRALGTKPNPIRGSRPTGPRSIREQAIRAIVDGIARPNASPPVRRELAEQIRVQADGVAASAGGVPAPFLTAYLAVVTPDRPSTEELRADAANLYYSIRFQLIAAEVLDALCADRDDVRGFWGWVGRYATDKLEVGTLEGAPPEWIRLRDPTPEQVHALSRGLERSCAFALTYSGVGLRILAGGEWSATLIRPPILHGIEPNPTWGKPDQLLDLIDVERGRWGSSE